MFPSIFGPSAEELGTMPASIMMQPLGMSFRMWAAGTHDIMISAELIIDWRSLVNMSTFVTDARNGAFSRSFYNGVATRFPLPKITICFPIVLMLWYLKIVRIPKGVTGISVWKCEESQLE